MPASRHPTTPCLDAHAIPHRQWCRVPATWPVSTMFFLTLTRKSMLTQRGDLDVKAKPLWIIRHQRIHRPLHSPRFLSPRHRRVTSKMRTALVQGGLLCGGHTRRRDSPCFLAVAVTMRASMASGRMTPCMQQRPASRGDSPNRPV